MDKKILFINDISTISIVPELLAGTGCRVDVAMDSTTGLHQMDVQSYDLIMLLENPAAESWLICEKIRKLTGTPLIVISSNASTETCVKAINAGADYFMRKPFGPLELLARVISLFQRTTYRQPVSLTP